MDPIVKVEGLSKQYFIGRAQAPYGTLRESLMTMFRAPLNQLRSEPRPPEPSIWAIKDISFDVLPGEVVGIIGRNGAGKSTLLRILSRITEPTHGRVRIRGRVGSLLEVGTGFHPELTGRENIYLNGAVLGMKKTQIKQQFDEIVAFAEVADFIDTPVKYYSTGMYLRLAFAVAAHLEPEILIVDEVLAVGDVQFQKKCLGKMDEVARAGRTVLFVSHNMMAVTQLCATCIWIDHGQLVKRGASGKVVTDYLSSFHPKHDTDGVITPEMHGHDPMELVFTQIKMLDRNGIAVRAAHFGSRLRFEIHFSVQQQVVDGRLGIAINNFDEAVVCAVHHTDDNRLSLLNLQPGNYIAQMMVDVPLMPGRYSVSLFGKPNGGYWSSGDRSLDHIQNAFGFHIDEVSQEGLPVLPTEGFVRPPSEWTISPL